MNKASGEDNIINEMLKTDQFSLNCKLMMFLKDNNLNSKYQIGFIPGSRPADHILTKKTLSDKYLGKKKNCIVGL